MLLAVGAVLAVLVVASNLPTGTGTLFAPTRRLGGIVKYFLIGNLGTLLGVWDWMTGRIPTRWEPVADDVEQSP
jgi:hypothetical protein